MALDYVGSYNAQNHADLLHYGVRGMKWGVRNDRKLTSAPSKVAKAAPTRARKREEREIAKSKEIDRLTGLRDRVESGKATVSRNGKKLSTDQALKAIDSDINKLARGNKVVEKKTNILVDKFETPSKSALKKDMDGEESTILKYNRLKAEVAKKGASSLDDEDLKFLNARREAINKANAAYKNPDSWLVKTVKAAVDASSSKLLKDVTQAAMTKHVATKLHTKLNLPLPSKPPTPTPTP